MSVFQENKSPKVKVILVGETAVGKSSIITQYCKNTFDINQTPTTSCFFCSKEIQIPKTTSSLLLNIWDTAGNERYHSLTKIFFKDAQIILFIYDITNKDSFNEINDYWYNISLTHCREERILILVGNKNDLDNKREVSKEKGLNYAKNIDALFFEVSALNGNGIKELFDKIAIKYGKKIKLLEGFESESITLKETDNKVIKRQCFC